jgi:RNA polymerase sigma-70 factor (ECF subfamily)
MSDAHASADDTERAALGAFEAERCHLRSLAYRMLGSLADADDVVQDTWLRWQGIGAHRRAEIERPSAWLTTAATRLALDRLKSAQRQREEYIGPWLPEPVLTDHDPAESVVLAESLTLGFLTVLERLGPVERAVFLLADVFDEPFASIAATVGRSEEACRQIASRARRRVSDERRRFEPADSDALLQAFVAACSVGSIDAFRKVLTDDVVLVSDGGADVHAARRPVVGLDRVVRLLANLARRLPADIDIEFHRVNHEPGLVVRRNGLPWYVLVLAVRDGRAEAVRLVLNPAKLHRLGQVVVL